MLSSRDHLNQITFKKKIVFNIIMYLMIMIFCVIGGELIIRLISPLNFRYPGYSFSKKYGSIVFKNLKIRNGVPGKWNCVYSINNYQYRGKLIPLRKKYKKKNIVVLGDWYAFGIGVNDGYEFPAVIFKILEKKFNVINLSIPNWGLTQQIRRYFEFGSLYKPDFVILQFCGNDPKDNFKNMVTKIREGKFVYFNSNNELNKFKKFLSNSVLQKSQLFCLLKKVIYSFFEKRLKDKSMDLYLKKNSLMTKIPPPGELL